MRKVVHQTVKPAPYQRLLFVWLVGACRVVEFAPELDPQSVCGVPIYPQGTTLHLRPYLQSITEESAQVMFSLEESSLEAATVEIFPAGTTLVQEASTEVELFSHLRTQMSFDYSQHKARIEGLSPNTEYCYRIFAHDQLIADGLSFRTAKPPGELTRIFALGDFGTTTSPARGIVARMIVEFNQARPDVLLTTGDNAYSSGTYHQIDERPRTLLAELTALMPYYPSWGNHDYETNDAGPSLDVYSLPENALRPEDHERYYSFDWGDVHFIALDTEGSFSQISDERDDDMLDWLRQDLEKTDRRWKIAYFHRPPYSSGRHGSSLEVREAFSPIFEEYGVQLVLTGHDHTYERSVEIDGVVYVVTGGGGQWLYRVGESDFTVVSKRDHNFSVIEASPSQLTLRAINIQGEVIDEFTLSQ